VDVPDEDGGALRVATPADFAGTPWAPRHRAPKLGEHTVEVLGELGLDAAGIDALVATGATDLSEGTSDQGF
jgi:crotonobetainyl-CoA:carnitine CoA-transferase CaiB-like acyl-CoA transferase